MKFNQSKVKKKSNHGKALREAMKETTSFFSRGNVFLQNGKIKTAEEIQERLNRDIRFDFSSL